MIVKKVAVLDIGCLASVDLVSIEEEFVGVLIAGIYCIRPLWELNVVRFTI